MFCKKANLKILQFSESLFNDFAGLQAVKLASLLKKDSGTGVYLWNLKNFLEHLFYRTPPGDSLFHVQIAGFQPAFKMKVFHGYFSRILYKSAKKPLEEVHLMKISEIYVKKLICSNVAGCQPGSFLRNLLQMYFLQCFAFILLKCITITSSEKALKYSKHPFTFI